MDESDRRDEIEWREERGKGDCSIDGKYDLLLQIKAREKERKWQEEKMEFRGKVEKETMEKLIREQIKELVRESKEDTRRRDEEIKKQREEIESLKRKVHRLEQGAGKRKREDSEESRGTQEEEKWWAEDERNDEESRKKNVIIRIEKNRRIRKGTSWEKVRKLLAEGLKIKVEVREVSVIGQRGEWVTVLVRMGSEKDKWRVLEARRREGNKLRIKMDEDKSVERRVREREEKERNKERRKEEGGRLCRTADEEIAGKMEESLLMDSDEDDEDRKGGKAKAE
ncbi:uncharacterized protein [Temnothorax nylanderi]|uniref:uncharacterized protein n=1 Tax=Temnothorax nylanderi TaxID=102681 RepID=UPI003A8C0703